MGSTIKTLSRNNFSNHLNFKTCNIIWKVPAGNTKSVPLASFYVNNDLANVLATHEQKSVPVFGAPVKVSISFIVFSRGRYNRYD